MTQKTKPIGRKRRLRYIGNPTVCHQRYGAEGWDFLNPNKTIPDLVAESGLTLYYVRKIIKYLEDNPLPSTLPLKRTPQRTKRAKKVGGAHHFNLDISTNAVRAAYGKDFMNPTKGIPELATDYCLSMVNVNRIIERLKDDSTAPPIDTMDITILLTAFSVKRGEQLTDEQINIIRAFTNDHRLSWRDATKVMRYINDSITLDPSVLLALKDQWIESTWCGDEHDIILEEIIENRDEILQEVLDNLTEEDKEVMKSIPQLKEESIERTRIFAICLIGCIIVGFATTYYYMDKNPDDNSFSRYELHLLH